MTIGFILIWMVSLLTPPNSLSSLKALADSLGISIDETFNETLKGISRMDSLDRILAHGHRENAFTQQKRSLSSAK